MPASPPPQEVIDAITASTSYVTRRVEIYESDASTRWAPDTVFRLLDGSVTVDSTATERRTVDLVLANDDGVLSAYPKSFWYDKILKVYRGVQVPVISPKIAIIYDGNGAGAANLKTRLQTIGYTDITINAKIRTQAQILKYDLIVALAENGAITDATVQSLLNYAYGAGKSVFTNGNDNSQTHLPTLITSTASKSSASPAYRIEPSGSGHFASVGWVTEDQSGDTGTLPNGLVAGTVPVALQTNYPGVALGYTAFAQTHPTSNGRWFHFHDQLVTAGGQAAVLIQRAFDWLDDNRSRVTSWEVQCGEFMIDNISKANFPHTVKVKGRDYTKKLMLSKFTRAVTFTKGTNLDSIIRALAANAGISTKKMSIQGNGQKIGRDFHFERGVTRKDAIDQLVTAYNHITYFDNQGYFIMGEDPDPAGKSSMFTFQGGTNGTLASYEKSTNDSRIYNHIVVIGGASDSAPIYSEAKNTDNTTATSIDNLGDRVYEYASSFITTQDQADSVAKSLLARNALEEYNVTMNSIVLPWLDANQVIDFIDPQASPGDPSRFLMVKITLPLKLGAMSVEARRVIAITPG